MLALSMTGSALQRQTRVNQRWEEQTLQQLESGDFQIQIETLQLLGQIGSESPRGLIGIGQSLEHENAEVRCAAVDALGEVGAGARSYVTALIRAKNNDPDPRVRSAAQLAIQEIQESPRESQFWLLPVLFSVLAVAAGAVWYWWTGQRDTALSLSSSPTAPD